jgi:hypothetical protein
MCVNDSRQGAPLFGSPHGRFSAAPRLDATSIVVPNLNPIVCGGGSPAGSEGRAGRSQQQEGRAAADWRRVASSGSGGQRGKPARG